MEIVGRITANAQVKTVKDDRKVVEFSIAVNDRYKTAAGQIVDTVNFYRCAYWIGVGVAGYLTKGRLIQVTGRLSVAPWITAEGEARASLNFHVTAIKFLTKGELLPEANTDARSGKEKPRNKKAGVAAGDDLPF